MDPVYKSDIFFFIASVGFIVLGLALAVVLAYAAFILNDLKHISKKARIETDNLAGDLQELRANVRQEGAKVKHFGKFLNSIYKRYK